MRNLVVYWLNWICRLVVWSLHGRVMRKLSKALFVASICVVVVSTTALRSRSSSDMHSSMQLRALASNTNLNVLSLKGAKVGGKFRDHLRDLLFLTSRSSRREYVLRWRSWRLVLPCTSYWRVHVQQLQGVCGIGWLDLRLEGFKLLVRQVSILFKGSLRLKVTFIHLFCVIHEECSTAIGHIARYEVLQHNIRRKLISVC